MKIWQYAVIFLVILVSYLLYTPVPDGITEPFKYRRLVAGTRLLDLIVDAYDLIWPNHPNDVHVYRTIPRLLMNTPPEVTPGSKFKASVTSFDGVDVRLYEPLHKRTELLPGFVYIHGGGYCIMNTELYDGLTRQLADELDSVVVSVEYRRSPDVKFPVPFEDTLKAVKWFFRHAKEYGVDVSRIGIGGDSTGGALTALTSQHLHDDKTLPDNKLQVLIYPAVQKINSWGPSYQKYEYNFGDGGMLSRKKMARFLTYQLFGKVDEEFEKKYLENNHTSSEFKKSQKYQAITDVSVIAEELRDPVYFSGPSNKDHGDPEMWARIKDTVLDPRMSAMSRTDFSGLPEAFVATCGFDSLRDDGILYSNVLREAGVKVKWVHYEEAFHGIFWLGPTFNFDLGVRMRKEAIEFIKQKL